jgi:hypothetical protein
MDMTVDDPSSECGKPSELPRRLAAGGSAIRRASARVVRVAQNADDPPGERVLDLAVPWDGLGHSGGRVPIPVVLAP